MKKLLKFIFIVLVFFSLSIIIPNQLIIKNANNKTFNSVENIPHNKVGLVLGASKYVTGGYINLYYKYRIEAAVSLFNSGKVEFILVSGDNGSKSYDEPSTFKEDLIKEGIPKDKIFLDYAGFRTLDSMARAKEIFGQAAITVISQKFHNERAIYLAEKFGIQAIGFNATNVRNSYGRATKYREYLARTKAVLDITLGIEPKFYGEPIQIQ